MAKKPTITTVSSGYYSTETMNANFTELRDAFDNTVSLDGSVPNAMNADLDLNGNDILNVNTIDVQDFSVNGGSINGYLTDAQTAATSAAASASSALADANRAETAAFEASLYDGAEIDTFSDLASVTSSQVAVGGIVYERELGQTFIRAPDSATDSNYNYSSGIGVKWYGQGDVKKPLAIMTIGQSNMRGVTTTVGGDISSPVGPMSWGNDISAGILDDGTAFARMRNGTFPSNVFDGVDFKITLPVALMRILQQETDSPIYNLTVAKGGHGIEAFIPDAVRVTNGWSLLSGDTDLSVHLFSNAAAALAAIPEGSGYFDVVFVHQGERNMLEGDTVSEYRQKLFALFNEMILQGLIHGTKTKIVFGGIAEVNSRYADHKASITTSLSSALRQVRYADSKALPLLGDNIHFTANGIDGMAVRMVDAMGTAGFQSMGSDDNDPMTIEVADAETGGNVGVATASVNTRVHRTGGTVTAFIELTNIDTTGMTAGNDVWFRGLNYPCRLNQPAEGSVRVANINVSTGYATAFLGAGKSAIRLARSVSNAGGYYLKVSDLTSGTASVRIGITYSIDT